MAYAPVYSNALISVQGLDGTFEYTVEDGYVAILRDLDVYYGCGVAGGDIDLIGSAEQTIWHESSGAPSGWVYWAWRGRQVIGSGQTVKVSTTDAMDVSLSGYLLTAG